MATGALGSHRGHANATGERRLRPPRSRSEPRPVPSWGEPSGCTRLPSRCGRPSCRWRSSSSLAQARERGLGVCGSEPVARDHVVAGPRIASPRRRSNTAARASPLVLS